MDMNHDALDQIALTLTKHFDSLYYVDIETGNYTEYISGNMLEKVGIPKNGNNFFTDAQQNASKCVHPDDLDLVIGLHEKAAMLEHLSQSRFYSVVYRLIIYGEIIRVRHFEMMCEDK